MTMDKNIISDKNSSGMFTMKKFNEGIRINSEYVIPTLQKAFDINVFSHFEKTDPRFDKVFKIDLFFESKKIGSHLCSLRVQHAKFRTVAIRLKEINDFFDIGNATNPKSTLFITTLTAYQQVYIIPMVKLMEEARKCAELCAKLGHDTLKELGYSIRHSNQNGNHTDHDFLCISIDYLLEHGLILETLSYELPKLQGPIDELKKLVAERREQEVGASV